MEKIHIQQWDEEKFLDARKEWNDLLIRSNSDQLFLSWEWQSSWWRVFSDKTMQLMLLAVIDDDGKLIGLAPLYTSSTTTKHISSKRLQFIGNCWRGRATMPTELLDFIADKSQSEAIIRALYCYLDKNNDWDEIIFPYLNTASETYRLLVAENLLTGSYYRHAERYRSYYLNTDENFKQYCSRLGKNTRLKLINRRKVFETIGDTTLETTRTKHIDKTVIDQHFELLNQLHKNRWGKSAFENKRLDFNRRVATFMTENGQLNFSVLSLNDNPVSIQYNYIANNRNYNIQAGFEENLHKKISLGYLHFGYEIETSFETGMDAYDFLAGEGKNTPYKERLTDTYMEIVDLQVIRKPLLKVLYRLNEIKEKILPASG